jgi:hypothetical protein
LIQQQPVSFLFLTPGKQHCHAPLYAQTKRQPEVEAQSVKDHTAGGEALSTVTVNARAQ